MPSRTSLARWSRNRGAVRAAEGLAELERDLSVKVAGVVEVHDGDCAWPQGHCDCESLVLEVRRHRGLLRSGGGPPSSSP